MVFVHKILLVLLLVLYIVPNHVVVGTDRWVSVYEEDVVVEVVKTDELPYFACNVVSPTNGDVECEVEGGADACEGYCIRIDKTTGVCLEYKKKPLEKDSIYAYSNCVIKIKYPYKNGSIVAGEFEQNVTVRYKGRETVSETKYKDYISMVVDDDIDSFPRYTYICENMDADSCSEKNLNYVLLKVNDKLTVFSTYLIYLGVDSTKNKKTFIVNFSTGYSFSYDKKNTAKNIEFMYPPEFTVKIKNLWVPQKPELTAPVEKDFFSPVSPEFEWKHVFGADAYKIKIYEKDNPSDLIVDKMVVGEPKNINKNENKADKTANGEIACSKTCYDKVFGYGKYVWNVTPCNVLFDYDYNPVKVYFDCFEESTSTGYFNVSDQVEPDVNIIFYKEDGTQIGFDPNKWYNEKLVVRVKCEDNVNCKMVGINISDNPTCPVDEGSYDKTEQIGSPIYSPEKTIDSKKYVCGIGNDSFDNQVFIGPIEVKIDRDDPTIIAPSCIKADTDFMIRFTDTLSGIKEVKYCETDVVGTCNPDIPTIINCNADKKECTNKTKIPEDRKRIYKAIDSAGNFYITTITAGGLELEIKYDKNNIWTNEDQKIEVSAITSCGSIDTVKSCNTTIGGACNAIDGESLTNLGYAQTSISGGYKYDLTINYEINKTLNFTANNSVGAWVDGNIVVKIDKTQPNTDSRCCDGGDCSDSGCDDVNFVLINITATDLSGTANSGIKEVRYCVGDDCNPESGVSTNNCGTIDLNNGDRCIGSSCNAEGTECNYSIVIGRNFPNYNNFQDQEGVYVLRYRAWDNAGNSYDNKKTIKILPHTDLTIDYATGCKNINSVDVIVTKTGIVDGFVLEAEEGNLNSGECGPFSSSNMALPCDNAKPCEFGLDSSKTVVVDGLEDGKCYKFRARIGNIISPWGGELKIDRTAPNIGGFDIINTAGDSVKDKWAGGVFSVVWNALDGGCGVGSEDLYEKSCSPAESCSVSFILSDTPIASSSPYFKASIDNNYNYTYKLNVSDNAGNFFVAFASTKTDTLSPTCNFESVASTGNTNEYRVSITLSDAESGVESYMLSISNSQPTYKPTESFTIPESQIDETRIISGTDNRIWCGVKDAVGNLEWFSYNLVSPESFIVPLPEWLNTTNVVVRFGSKLAVSCVNVNYTKYNNGPNWNFIEEVNLGCFALCSTPPCSGENSVSVKGENRVNFTFKVWATTGSIDEAFLHETSTIIDTLPPLYTLKHNGDALVCRSGMVCGDLSKIIIAGTDDFIIEELKIWDTISGIEECLVKVGGNLKKKCGSTNPWGAETNAYDCAEPNIVLGKTENTLLSVYERDRAGNINEVNYVVTLHPLVYFVKKNVFVYPGEVYDVDLVIRNLLEVEQTINVNIGVDMGDYQLARFLDVGVGTLSSNKKSMEVTLNPREVIIAKIRITSSGDVGEHYLNMEAESDKIDYKDGGMLTIKIGYPPGFSGLEEFSVALLLVLVVWVYRKIGKY